MKKLFITNHHLIKQSSILQETKIIIEIIKITNPNSFFG